MASSNSYMRVYMAERYARRKAAALKQLGGKCAKCPSTEALQFDHIDPAEKGWTITKFLAGASEARLQEELKKCQLLCGGCHQEKTLKDLGQENAKEVHGTLSSYRYCKCELCRKAKREANRQYRLSRTAVV